MNKDEIIQHLRNQFTDERDKFLFDYTLYDLKTKGSSAVADTPETWADLSPLDKRLVVIEAVKSNLTVTKAAAELGILPQTLHNFMVRQKMPSKDIKSGKLIS